MRWVEKYHTALYRELTEELPGEIDRTWNSSMPLDQFQAVFDRWVESHEKVVKLYAMNCRTRREEVDQPE